ncbi:MAG: fibronectin type III domain-containing protein [Actinomycetes bacterium]|jgi:hypothetical protein|nr:fibronectin type III domain-containing protein [Actinomycetes bacterium]
MMGSMGLRERVSAYLKTAIVLICVCLLLSVAAIAGARELSSDGYLWITDGAGNNVPVVIEGVVQTSSGTGWAYAPETNTLTLNNCALEHIVGDGMGEVHLVIIGEVSIIRSDDYSPIEFYGRLSWDEEEDEDVYIPGSVVITGDSTARLICENVAPNSGGAGIYGRDGITISGELYVKATGGWAGLGSNEDAAITITGKPTVIAENQADYYWNEDCDWNAPIWAHYIQIDGGTITCNILGDVFNNVIPSSITAGGGDGGSSVTITGGTVNAPDGIRSTGDNAGVIITGGIVNAPWDRVTPAPVDGSGETVTDPAVGRTVLVINGSGSGSYKPGTVVPITANAPVEGKVFDKWLVYGGGSVANVNASSTTFTVPIVGSSFTLMASYKNAPVTTPSGTDSGDKTTTPSGTNPSTTVTKPGKVTVKSVKAAKKKVTVKWKKLAAAQKVTKYQVQYRIKGKKWQTKYIKAAAAKKSSLVIKKLKKGKKYQFRVRAYKTVGGKKYYGAWSKVKTSGTVK